MLISARIRILAGALLVSSVVGIYLVTSLVA